MKRIIIICEGQTEQEFCKTILQPYFNLKSVCISPSLIKKSKGGIVSWKHLKKQIENHLKQDNTVLITTFFDYYGIKNEHDFPLWKESKKIIDKFKRISFLEDGMKNDLEKKIKKRFIPYIQLHEFEGLLFVDIQSFNNNFQKSEIDNYKDLEDIFTKFSNPELINDLPETAPSKRLQKFIKGYNKIVHGIILAETIGLRRIRQKCSRFNKWILKLENI